MLEQNDFKKTELLIGSNKDEGEIYVCHSNFTKVLTFEPIF